MRLLSPEDFVASPYPVPLAADEIQLWFFAACPRGESGARVAALLASYLHCAPAALAIVRGEFGKPRLQSAALEFNLSHSREALLVGISRAQALGVDIETTQRDRPAVELARRFFDPAEATVLAGLDGAARQAAFVALWSCKEAVVKAIGCGLSFGLRRAAFAFDAAGAPARLNVIDASAGALGEWQIVQLRPALHCTGALAWRGPARPIRAFTALAR